MRYPRDGSAPHWDDLGGSGGFGGGGKEGKPRCHLFLSLSLVPNREFRFTSEVPIWLDYHGKHVTVDQVVSRTPWLVLLSRTHKLAQRKPPPQQS